MNATRQLHALGQSLWLDNITHALLTSGTFDRYIRELAVTGLTSNPTIFDHAIERRIAASLDPRVASVASVFVSRWNVAVGDKVSDALRNHLGIAVAMRTYKAYRELLGSSRWQKLAARGALPQRLLWGSTGSRDPTAPDGLYIEALAAPDTINTVPEKTLLAFADHGAVKGTMPPDGGDAEAVLADFAAAGVNDDTLAADLQREGTAAFVKSWHEPIHRVALKRSS